MATEKRSTAAAATDPVRDAEIAALRKERDELRERLRGGVADELAMLRAEVHALAQAAARAGLTVGPRHMSEGVREELERVGHAVDPFTGAKLTRADLP
jgi:hypothetical protein